MGLARTIVSVYTRHLSMKIILTAGFESHHPPSEIYILLCKISVWTLGYNDFNNLYMQTLWWLPNKILRHIHKKRFCVFLSCFLPICNQSLQKVLVRAKKYLLKNSIWVSKNAEFHADFESVEKVLKKCTQKNVISKSVTEICTFFTFDLSLLNVCKNVP